MKKAYDYYHGIFTAIVQSKDRSLLEGHTFQDLEFYHIEIGRVSRLASFNPEEQRAGLHLYRNQLTVGHTGRNPFRKQGYVLFPRSTDQIYSGKIYQVIFKKFQIPDNGERLRLLAPGYFLLQGDIYFGQPAKEAVPSTNPIVAEHPVTAPGITRLNEQLQRQINKGCFNPVMNASQTITTLMERSVHSAPSQFLRQNAPGFLVRIWQSLVFFFLIVMSFLMGQFIPALGVIAAVLSLLWLISRWRPSLPFRAGYGWALLGLLLFFLLLFRESLQTDLRPQETGEGEVKQAKPEEFVQEDGQSRSKDYRYKKSISWFDFGKRNYRTDYATTSLQFLQSKDNREGLKEKYLGNDEISYMSSLYAQLLANDQPKLDSLAADFKNKSIVRRLTPLQSAEMVTTFVQEIDYVLVHDHSCKQSIAEDGDFVRQYHRQQKPCLPRTFAGVQSPYEFAHNLKGDCDTRVLLAHALLTRLGISSSVWISPVYGHSILGVGVQTGFGPNKDVRGIKHYPVELTAKGFKIGMISPEQHNMRNWIITNYKNF